MRNTLLIVAFLISDVAFGSDTLHCDQPISQLDINLCSIASASNVKKKFQALLGELQHSLSPENWKLLQKSQQKWEGVEKLDCEIEGSFIDGGRRLPTKKWTPIG